MTYKNKKDTEIKDEFVHLSSFFKLIPNPILEIDLKGNIIYANRAARSLVLKMKKIERKHPFLRGLDSCVKKLRKSKNKYFEREIEAGGRWYMQSILLDDSNHLRVFSSDITDYKLAKNTLKESEDKYRTMIEYSNDMIWTLDKKGKFLFFNKHAEEITGYKLKDWIGKPFTRLISKEDLSRLVDMFKKTLSGKSTQYEVTIFSKNKQMVSLLVNSAPLFSNGVIIGTISFGKNITEYRKTEKALKESEEKYRDLYEEAPDAYYSIGTNGRILKANKRASELYGLSSESLVGKLIYKLYADTPTGKVKAKEIFNRFLSGKEIKGEELEMRRINGKTTWISLSVKPIRDADGNIIASRSIAIDITERKEAEKALKNSNDFLENLLA
ncbi:MAG: PAS domain-containing protein, partial [Candidatus Pacebacteria bacterium]|nr:PAS domain-containing protein [Candidatus Paceibacterota bacterium]